jgi:hypothetical protein
VDDTAAPAPCWARPWQQPQNRSCEAERSPDSRCLGVTCFRTETVPERADRGVTRSSQFQPTASPGESLAHRHSPCVQSLTAAMAAEDAHAAGLTQTAGGQNSPKTQVLGFGIHNPCHNGAESLGHHIQLVPREERPEGCGQFSKKGRQARKECHRTEMSFLNY